ncbi:MAG: 50S ribosomal protein L21 [Patescibacteria group bacterium]
MKIAVIKTGGKQYTVAEKNKIKIEKLAGEVGQSIDFKEVLLLADGAQIKVGQPHVSGIKVTGKILKQARDKKILVVKYKNKTRYRRNVGHRQTFTEVEIEKIA